MKVENQNSEYNYFLKNINAFFTKEYKNIWYRISLHLIFWTFICSIDIVTALFKWPSAIPTKYYFYFVLPEIPTIIFFYFIFYFKPIKNFIIKFVLGFILFYLVTHLIQSLNVYITINDKALYKTTSKLILNLYSDAGWFGFFDKRIISANLYSMSFGFFPISFKVAKDLYFTSLQKQLLQIESTKAELYYLRNQINPHFIFNVINNAYYFVFKKDQESAELLLKLSNIIRYTIEESSEDVIGIQKEITILKDLISIEKIRSSTHSKLTYEENINSLNLDNIKILPLAFVTLLENSIKHGVGTNNSRGFVDCNLYISNKEVRFSVINSINITNIKPTTGIGLNNLKRRLDLLYKNNYQLSNYEHDNKYFAEIVIKL